jgi:membrane dipeptidase
MIEPEGSYLVDAHEDIAFHCLEYGRDLVDPGTVECMITLPWLQSLNVRLICATLFTEPRHSNAVRRYQMHSQYEMYRQWFSQHTDSLWLIKSRSDLARLAGARPISAVGRQVFPIGVILLMEGCDLLENPTEVQTWWERGVRMACVTWNGKNRYASGCFSDGKGLSQPGRELLKEFSRLGMILDLSHLTERAISEALEDFDGPLCSGHTNARAICRNERNLTDDHAKQIAERGGVIGLNLLAPLLIFGWRRGDPLPPVAAATQHSAYLAELCGPEHIGIGADLDGGLTPANTPQGIDRINHLPLLADDLRVRGWDEDRVAGFLGRNWWRFFEHALPE